VVANHPVKILRIKNKIHHQFAYKNNNEPMDSVNITEFHDLQNYYKFFKRGLCSMKSEMEETMC
jgi:hypothetical protein